jgi:hypothetical protein
VNPFQAYINSLQQGEPGPVLSPLAFAAKSQNIEDDRTPKSLKEALLGPDREKWLDGITEELDEIDHHGTYSYGHPPVGQRPLNLKYVFKIKPAQDGKPERFKVRVVVRGDEAVDGVDYNGTSLYAPVVMYKSLRFTVSLAAQLGMSLHKMDVKTAFLNGDLEETVYVVPPLGVVPPPGKEGMMWKLEKSLYGLKQAPRQWNIKLNEYLVDVLHYKRLDSDWGIYVKWFGTNLMVIDVYVDDLFIGCADDQPLLDTKKDLAARFDLVDFGEAKSILGINIRQSGDSITLDQQSYIDDLVTRFNQEESKGKVSPTELGRRFSVDQAPDTTLSKTRMERTPYREAVGSLMHLMVCTRPDIAYAVGVVSRYLENPGPAHWDAVQRIIQYVKLTRNYCLEYKKVPAIQGVIGDLHGYCDADWAGDRDDYRSTAGWVFLMGGAAISWSSKKISSPAQSTCEAEYVAQGRASMEQVWYRQLMQEMRVAPTGAISIYSDSQSAINLANNPAFHDKSKHIALKYHLIRHLISEGQICLEYVPTEVQVADCLTKALSGTRMDECRRQLGLVPLKELDG